MIQVTRSIAIDESEIQEEFIRSSGPGGQNVNKVATAVQLRFDVVNSPSLPDDVRQRLISLARRRITEDGVLIIDARRFRTQARNRQDTIERLTELVRTAAQKPRIRRKTRPTLASKVHQSRQAAPFDLTYIYSQILSIIDPGYVSPYLGYQCGLFEP